MSSLSKTERAVLYLFERPFQPLYMPRANFSLIYNLPGQSQQEAVISTRFGGRSTKIDITEVTSVEQLPASVRNLKKGKIFSHFVPTHMKAARELMEMMMKLNDVEELLNFAANIRDGINEMLFVFVLSEVILRKPQFRHIGTPSFVEIMASNFIPQPTIDKVMTSAAEAEVSEQQPERIVIDHDANFSGTNLNPENRVSYWREDYGINAHHWHWHLVFPLRMGIQVDRKGEMFFYMHQQMMARYDMERLSNGLNRTVQISDLRAPIKEGYFPKLNLSNAGQNWGSRQDNTVLSDFRRGGVFEPFTISDMETWHQRILDGIHRSQFINEQGEAVPLSDDVDVLSGQKRGIDIIGDTFEADSDISVNFRFYGDLHNLGHVLIASAHDPDGSHKEEFGVIGASATAMRDPVFYRWHRYVDNIFQEYKMGQRPYTEEELVVEGLTVERVGVRTGADGYILKTFFDQIRVEASRGIDFRTPMPVDINLTRLNHQEFDYQIMVQNALETPKKVTVRLFLAPKFNESGDELNYMDQRTLWAEMDKFTHTMEPGENHLVRNSKDSSITIPEEATFAELDTNTDRPARNDAFCGCGWPEHMLVPRGNHQGMPFYIYVLLSDYELDRVDNDNRTKSRCGKAVSYCGLLDSKFPDRRPMGFPFDRRPVPSIDTIHDFVRIIPNSRVEEIVIRHRQEKAEHDLERSLIFPNS